MPRKKDRFPVAPGVFVYRRYRKWWADIRLKGLRTKKNLRKKLCELIGPKNRQGRNHPSAIIEKDGGAKWPGKTTFEPGPSSFVSRRLSQD